ncbi:MAG: IS30 family transposase [Candidatus Saccharimonadales bacterium]
MDQANRRTHKTEHTKKYTGLSDAERSEIATLLKRNLSMREIALALERSPNTISLEIRNNSVDGRYNAKKAKAKSRLSRKSRRFQWQKIEQDTRLRDFIITHLSPPYDWSPGAIAGYLKHEQTELAYVSSPQMYAWLYSPLGQPYCQYLCTKRYRPKHHTKKTERVMIPDRVSITERPASARERLQAGHWEYDSIVSGKRSGSKAALAVAQERVTKLVRVTLVPNLKPEPYAQTILRLVVGFLVTTMTTDNGIENKQHKLITAARNVIVYFTDPYSSWQKGGVENVNKMIRRYFPKGTNFSDVTQSQVDEAVRRINNKPRASLGFKSALQSAQEKGLLLDEVS